MERMYHHHRHGGSAALSPLSSQRASGITERSKEFVCCFCCLLACLFVRPEVARDGCVASLTAAVLMMGFLCSVCVRMMGDRSEDWSCR